MTLVLFQIYSSSWMIANYAGPPRMSFKLRPHDIEQTDPSWLGFRLHMWLCTSAIERAFPRIFSLNRRKSVRLFFRDGTFLILCGAAANRRFVACFFWDFCKIGEESRHFRFLNEFPAEFRVHACAFRKCWRSTGIELNSRA